jgi:ABC-type branched-subunit amino acid transport system substrate-binding protein
VTVPMAEEVTSPNDMLMISPGSTSPFITMLPADKKKDYLFRTCPSDALQGVVLGKLAASLYKSNPFSFHLFVLNTICLS